MQNIGTSQAARSFCLNLVGEFYGAMKHTGVSGLPYGDHLQADFNSVRAFNAGQGSSLEVSIPEPIQAAEKLAFSLLLDSNNGNEMSTTFARRVLEPLPQLSDDEVMETVVEALGPQSCVKKILKTSGLRP